MSRDYKDASDVPTEIICNRLNELSDCVTRGVTKNSHEFTMRIPAECDRDADIVLAEAARRLQNLQAQVKGLEEENVAGQNILDMTNEELDKLQTQVDRIKALPDHWRKYSDFGEAYDCAIDLDKAINGDT